MLDLTLDPTEFLKRRLNGRGTDPDPAAIAEVLTQLAQENEADAREIEKLAERRKQALLDGAHDAANVLYAEAGKVRDRIEERQLAVPVLRERLRGATAAERQRRLLSHREAYRAAATEYLQAARIAATKHWAVVVAIEQTRRDGFERESAMMPATPNINGSALLAPELLDLFGAGAAAYSRTQVTAPAAPRAPQPARARVLPAEKNLSDAQHAVSTHLTGPARRPTVRTPDDLRPLQPGEARVQYLGAGGWSPADDLPQCHHGQILILALRAGENAANLGLVKITERFQPAPDAAAPSDQEARP